MFGLTISKSLKTFLFSLGLALAFSSNSSLAASTSVDDYSASYRMGAMSGFFAPGIGLLPVFALPLVMGGADPSVVRKIEESYGDGHVVGVKLGATLLAGSLIASVVGGFPVPLVIKGLGYLYATEAAYVGLFVLKAALEEKGYKVEN